MNVLGINGGLGREAHDPAAFLLQDGIVVAAAEEERFSRMKFSVGKLPIEAIRYCLSAAELSLDDVAGIAFPQATWGSEFASRLCAVLRTNLGTCPPIYFYDHHRSHAASAYFGSGFDASLVITMDGSGDGVSTTVSAAAARDIRLIRSWQYPQSLGLFFSMMTQFLGLKRNNEEYKLMSLAAYGDPSTDLPRVLDVYRGDYRMEESWLHPYVTSAIYPRYLTTQEPAFGDRLVAELGPPRLPSTPFTARHKAIAATAQAHLTEAVSSIVEAFLPHAGSSNVCLAGGVALNCVTNAAIAKLPGVGRVYVPPVANDSGCALGAAMLLSNEFGCRPAAVPAAYFGDSFDDDEVEARLTSLNIPYVSLSGPDLAQATVDELIAGKVVGWFQGRMEVGPRALGNRSILADPRTAQMKEILNTKIKRRHSFQPFAPAVLDEYADRIFDVRAPSRFMNFAWTVRDEWRGRLPAVIHEDGTSRLQAVGRDTNERFYDLLRCFQDRSNAPVLVNTSLNRSHEPIVRTPEEAVAVMFGTGMDSMVLGNSLVRKGR